MSSKFRPINLPGASPSLQQAYDTLTQLDLRHECDKARAYRRILNSLDIMNRYCSTNNAEAQPIRQQLAGVYTPILTLLTEVINYARASGHVQINQSLTDLIESGVIDNNGFLNYASERACELTQSLMGGFNNAITECDSCTCAEGLVNAHGELSSRLTAECRRYYGDEWGKTHNRLDSKYEELIDVERKKIKDLLDLMNHISANSTSAYNVESFEVLQRKLDAHKYELLIGLVDSNTVFSTHQKRVINESITKTFRSVNSGLEYHITRHTESQQALYR